MFKRDSIWFGFFLGILTPAILYLVLFMVGNRIEPDSRMSRIFEGNKPLFLSLILNLVIIRIYLVNLKMDRTGRGILLATFSLGMIFFIFFKNI